MPRGNSKIGSRTRLIVAALLLAAILSVYAQVNGFDFVRTDDTVYVTDNPRVVEGLSLQGVVWAFTTFEASNWHPLTWLSLMLDAETGGGDAATFHRTNLLLHAANTLLLFHLLASLTASTWRTGLVAALFAIHPLHVESVAWVAERKDVLSTLFWLLATLAYVAWTRRHGAARRLQVLVCFAFGLMAKPMLVTLPLTLLLFDHWPLRRKDPLRELVREKLPLFTLSAASCVVTLQAQWSVVGSFEHFPLTLRLGNALISYTWYLRKFLWPAGLTLHYPYDKDLSSILLVVSAVVLSAVTWLAWKGTKRQPYLLTGWLWYVITLLPVIGLVQVGRQPMADRYTYVPLIGIFVMIAWGVPDLLRLNRRGFDVSKLAVGGAAVVVVVALSWMAHRQVAHWRDSEALFTHALTVNDRNAVAHNGLALTLSQRGRIEEAMRHYAEALRIEPTSSFARTRLAALRVRTGDLTGAAGLYRQELERRPEAIRERLNLASILVLLGEHAQAVRHFEQAFARDPDDHEARANYGIALTRLARLPEAEAQFEEALRLQPDSVLAHKGLAAVMGLQGRLDAAVEHSKVALAIRPDDIEARLNLATYLMRRAEFGAAENALDEVLRLDPGHAIAHNQRGIVFFRQGRIDAAIAEFEEALRIDPSLDEVRRDLARMRALVEETRSPAP